MTRSQKLFVDLDSLTSKGAILILIWNLSFVAGLESLKLDPSFLGYNAEEDDNYTTTIVSGSLYSILAFYFLFYPLAGYLTDIHWGRYKTVINTNPLYPAIQAPFQENWTWDDLYSSPHFMYLSNGCLWTHTYQCE